MRITLGGHATVLIELDGVRLLTDPILRRRVAFLRAPHAGLLEARRSLDAILISHFHRDHLHPASLNLLDPSTLVVGPPGTARRLARRGFKRAVELRPGEQTSIGTVVVAATEARHGRLPGFLKTSAVGYLVRGSKTLYFAGDTDSFPGMADLASERIDIALLPIGGWGPRLGAGHLDPRRAAEALRLIRPATAIPIHWGFLRPIGAPAGTSYLTEPGRRFAELAAESAPEVAVRVLEPGEALEVDSDP